MGNMLERSDTGFVAGKQQLDAFYEGERGSGTDQNELRTAGKARNPNTTRFIDRKIRKRRLAIQSHCHRTRIFDSPSPKNCGNSTARWKRLRICRAGGGNVER